jgi:hypothetical protein
MHQQLREINNQLSEMLVEYSKYPETVRQILVTKNKNQDNQVTRQKDLAGVPRINSEKSIHNA